MEASQTYHELAGEIDRIVNSPYPAQLKHLRDLLYTKCTNGDVSRWVHSRACQIKTLASCILDGLRQWPYVSDIIARLSCNVTFRNALLHGEPHLLHDCIVRAVDDGDITSAHTMAAVAILSHRLPDNLALPAECQNLVVQLFEYAAQRPSVATIRPIYQVLKGTSTTLLGMLSSGILRRFEDHLFNIVRNLKGDDQSLSLYCLAIMKILAAPSGVQFDAISTSSFDTQELLASTQFSSASTWKPDTVRQYFTERKAQKTMQLVVLRVMWACTATTGDSLEEKMESLRLANEIIAAVPEQERDVWRKANVLVPKKFEEKVLSPAMDSALRFHALLFLLRLSDSGSVSNPVMSALRRTLIDTREIAHLIDDSEGVLAEGLVGSAVFDVDTTTALMQNIVDFATGSGSYEAVEQCGQLTILLQQLQSQMTDREATVDGIMLALDVLSCGNKLRSLSDLVSNSPRRVLEAMEMGFCSKACEATRRRLVHELCNVFLKATLCSANSTYSIPQDTLLLLLGLHASSAQLVECSHQSRPAHIGQRMLSVAESLGPTNDCASDWRQRIQNELHLRASSECERLESIFTKACSELEDRCQNVERPLQEERAKLLALQEKFNELNEAYTALENDDIDRKVGFDALEMERDQYMTDLDNAREINERLESRVAELEAKLQASKSRAQEAESSLKHSLERAQFEHAATLASKHEELEDLQAAIQVAGQKLQDRNEELDQLRKQLAAATSRCDALQQEAEQSGQRHSVLRTTMETTAKEKEDADQEVENLQGQITTMRAATAEAQSAHEAEIGRIRDQAEEDLRAAKTNHDKQMATMTTEQRQIREALELRVSEVEESCRQARETHMSELQQRHDEIRDRQKQLDRLHRHCERKDREIAEARAVQGQVRAALGLIGGQSAMAPQHHRSRSSTVLQEPHPTDSQEDPSPPTPFSGNDGEIPHTQTRSSFASNPSSEESRGGPTPKRPRPRKSFQVASPAKVHTKANTSGRASRTRASLHDVRKEQPLTDIGGNHSPAKTRPSRSLPATKLADLDEFTLDGSEVFAGTADEEMKDLGGVDDETTQI